MSSISSSQPAVVDAAEFTVRRTIRIAAPVEKVWSAVTEAGAHLPVVRPDRARRSPVPAPAARSPSPSAGSIPLRVEAMDAPRLVSYRWSNDDALERLPGELDVDHSTVFTFTLEPVSGGTQLTVVETGFDATSDPAANLESHRGGWEAELDKLVALLEGGS